MRAFMILFFVALTACGQQPVSGISSLEGEVDRSFAEFAGRWRMMARYDLSVIGSNGTYSGLTAVISPGDNQVSRFEGQMPCDLEVRSKDSDFNALDLPGGDGELMNPCAIIATTTEMFPYEGNPVVRGEHPAGGTAEVYYGDDGEFDGYSIEADGMGHILLSLNDGVPLPNGGGQEAAGQEIPAGEEIPFADSDPSTGVGPEGEIIPSANETL